MSNPARPNFEVNFELRRRSERVATRSHALQTPTPIIIGHQFTQITDASRVLLRHTDHLASRNVQRKLWSEPMNVDIVMYIAYKDINSRQRSSFITS